MLKTTRQKKAEKTCSGYKIQGPFKEDLKYTRAEIVKIKTDITAKRKSETCIKQEINLLLMDRDSSVGIATHYRLDGTGIEIRWGARLSAPVKTGPEAHPSSYTMDKAFSRA